MNPLYAKLRWRRARPAALKLLTRPSNVHHAAVE